MCSQNSTACWLSNKGKYAGLCLHPQRGAYKALPLPHLGASDHITVMLMPAHRPLVKVIQTPIHKQIQVWPEGSSEALQDCFDPLTGICLNRLPQQNTTDLQEYSETVTAYIHQVYWWCMYGHKTIMSGPNQKPWLTGEVYRLLKARNAAFRAGDEEGLGQLGPTYPAASERPRDISRRIAHRFSDSRRHSGPVAGDSDHYRLQAPTTDLWQHHPMLNELNAFFARLRHKTAPLHRRLPSSRRPDDDAVPARVRRSLRQDQCTQSSGSWQHSWACTERLCSGTHWCLTDIFNISLSQAVVPTCFKATTIFQSRRSHLHLLQWLPSSSTHSYSHEVLERLVMQHIKSVLPPSLDPFQFAYRSNRSTDWCPHTPRQNGHVCQIAVHRFQFSIQHNHPQQLIHKLVQLGLIRRCATGCWTSDRETSGSTGRQ